MGTTLPPTVSATMHHPAIALATAVTALLQSCCPARPQTRSPVRGGLRRPTPARREPASTHGGPAQPAGAPPLRRAAAPAVERWSESLLVGGPAPPTRAPPARPGRPGHIARSIGALHGAAFEHSDAA